MDPNCKKCSCCYYDKQWDEYICDKYKRAIVYRGEEALACRDFKQRDDNSNAN